MNMINNVVGKNIKNMNMFFRKLMKRKNTWGDNRVMKTSGPKRLSEEIKKNLKLKLT